ncbi:hypothetical protein CVS40_11708 [Lucilia cuprina]|nr:hypothetical protein CVS40_11708 [Lucilia cuprina]
MDDQNDDSLLQVLLKSFNLEEAYQYLKGSKLMTKRFQSIRRVIILFQEAGKGSPSGKLYFKYKNCRRKRGIFVSSVSSQDEAENTSEHLDIDEEIDESVATAFKTSLNRDSSDWADVL